MASAQLTPITDLRLNAAHYKILVCGSMEQIIGAGLSSLAGIMIPMLALLHPVAEGAVMQGIIGAIALVGIAVGSALFGKLADNAGYAFYYRLCPALIMLGGLSVVFIPTVGMLIAALFVVGLGVGGGYSLDSAYISELMPERWKLFMVGVAKAASALGFLLIPAVCWAILWKFPDADLWHWLMLIMAALGLITLLMRVRYPQSPVWLMTRGRTADAQKAARWFFGPDVEVLPLPKEEAVKPVGWFAMFKPSLRLDRVIFSGIPWAFEGVGVYGVGVFLPVLVMALGIAPSHSEGMSKVVGSIELTTIINFFILPGFVLGLLMVRRCSHVRMLWLGFIGFSAGVALVLAAYLLRWPVWISILGFVIFEVALNAGPHLITFILPTQIYPVAERGAGSGIAAMLGKVGAIAGVFLMPVLLKAGGITLILEFCIAVGVLGALITIIYGRRVMPADAPPGI